jgi:hypothetical protein
MNLMKILRWIAWISLGIAAVIMLIAAIVIIAHKWFCGGSCGNMVAHFQVANSLLLLAIALFIATKQCCCDKCYTDKCESKEEKKES